MKARHEFNQNAFDAIGNPSSKGSLRDSEAYKDYLRVEFAKAAMQGMLSDPSMVDRDMKHITRDSVKCADALISALEKQEK